VTTAGAALDLDYEDRFFYDKDLGDEVPLNVGTPPRARWEIRLEQLLDVARHLVLATWRELAPPDDEHSNTSGWLRISVRSRGSLSHNCPRRIQEAPVLGPLSGGRPPPPCNSVQRGNSSPSVQHATRNDANCGLLTSTQLRSHLHRIRKTPA
jgi:hypothetical protein